MMKRLICVLLIFTLVWTLSACRQAPADASEKASQDAEASAEDAQDVDAENAAENAQDVDEEAEAGDAEDVDAEAEAGDAEDVIAEDVPEPSMIFDFSKGLPEGFRISDGWTNGNMFNVTWHKENVTFDDGRMQLAIDHEKSASAKIPYSGAEIQSTDFYSYGRYEVSMKAIKNDGVVSSFFIYTGPSDNNPWDEIDFEILGKDPTKVQVNYFTNGQGNHEFMYDLGFDSSEEFHRYAFVWKEGQIDWYVDDVLIHTATANIPVTPAKIMTNAWCGIGVDSWLKPFDDSSLPVAAEYEWITYAELSGDEAAETQE